MSELRPLTIGSRGSKLALAQTRLVIDALKQKYPDVEMEPKIIVTKGDLDHSPIPLDTVGKDWFTAEIEQALLKGEIDIAVHSMKDLPPEIPEEIVTLAVLERADPREALVSKSGTALKDLPHGAVIGTDSARRRVVLLEARADLEIKSIRGNVDTRLRKLHDEPYDAIMLAAAGLARVGMSAVITEFLDPAIFIPAMGQGILAAQARRDRGEVLEMLRAIQHEPTVIAADAEQAFAGVVGGGCKTPIGCYVRVDGDTVYIDAFIQNGADMTVRRKSASGPAATAKQIAQDLAHALL
jgi:hydroxymethylbilane synthase